MAINVSVEIFVIKMLSVLNLVVISVVPFASGDRFRPDAKTSRVPVARFGAILNC
jgi:hypothetical protein